VPWVRKEKGKNLWENEERERHLIEHFDAADVKEKTFRKTLNNLVS